MSTRICSNLFCRAIAAVVGALLIVSISGTASAWPPGGNGGGHGGGGDGGTSAPYTLVDLEGFTVTYPGGTLIQSNAAAVNEPDGAGTVQVVGSSIFQLGDYTDYRIHPVLWEVKSDTSFASIDLGLPPQSFQAGASDINDLGVITINVGGSLDGTFPSWVSIPGEPLQKLPGTEFTGGYATSANGINNYLQVVGSASSGPSLWISTAGIFGDPIGLPGINSIAISDTGLMVGHDGQGGIGQNPWKDFSGGKLPALAWFDANEILHVEPIPQPPQPDGVLLEGSATDISPNGEWIAGYIVDPLRGAAQAFVWSDSTGMIFLDRLGGDDCMAVAVNNSGDVVGWSDTGNGTNPVSACLWQGGQVFDLNELAGANGSTNLVTAYGVNDAGHIVGYMKLRAKGGITEKHAFALIPNGQ